MSALLRTVLQDELHRAEAVSPSRVLVEALKSVSTVRRLSTVLFRSSQYFGSRVPGLGFALKQLNHVITGADIAWQCKIGPGLRLYHPTGVVIGPGVEIGPGCSVQQGVTLGGSGRSVGDGSPTLGSRVRLGAGSRVLGPVFVGDNVTVGANAVVLTSVPDNAVAVGVPARIIVRESTATGPEGRDSATS